MCRWDLLHLEVHSCDLALKHLGRVLECPRELGRGLERESLRGSIRNLIKSINLEEEVGEVIPFSL